MTRLCSHLCLVCGHVGCCDQSPHRHATAHFHATRHPAMGAPRRRVDRRRGASERR